MSSSGSDYSEYWQFNCSCGDKTEINRVGGSEDNFTDGRGRGRSFNEYVWKAGTGGDIDTR